MCGNMSTGCTLRSLYADSGACAGGLPAELSFQHSCARSLACRTAAGLETTKQWQNQFIHRPKPSTIVSTNAS